MMGATDIRICGEVGHVVRLEREGRRWQLPAEVGYHKGEPARWWLIDELIGGDRLTVPEPCTDDPVLVLANARSAPGPALSFWERVFGDQCVLIAFIVAAMCPACDTVAAHPVDIPTDLSAVSKSVIRTCITCDHSWRQEAAS